VASERTDSPAEPGLAPRPADTLRAELMRLRLREQMFGEPTAPPQIDRFRVLERIGSGGMGSVYLAWDEGLARSIALKFLHQREGDELVREAQALARIAHTNVVGVFDVGVHEGRVWLAMEYVPGRTLRDWQRSRPSLAERLARWIAAGRGLAAVHEAGLIHRDVKPDNVLLGVDGRVRLIDFGLVITGPNPTSQPSGGSDQGTESGRHVGFAGSREYAAPEQREGQPLDARADQYAFCVSVWEALAGERPERDLAGALLASDIPGVPRRVVAALRLGLAVEAHDRWPDMLALLEVLEPRRRRLDLVVAITLATGLGVGLGLAGRDGPLEVVDPCAQAGTGLDASTAAVLADGPLRVATEEWVGEWQHISVQSCEDHHSRAQGSQAVLDQRRACLEVRRLELVGLLEHLEDVQAGAVTLETRKLELGDPGACLLGADEALAVPAEHAEAIAELRHALGEIESHADEPALALLGEAEPLLAQAEAIAWPLVIAEAELMLARIHLQANDREPAIALTESALDLAEQHGQSELAAQAWSTMIAIDLDLDLDPKAARRAWNRKRAALERLDPSAYERGRLAGERASIAQLGGDFPAAEASLREAVDELEQAGLSGRLQLVTTLERLALVVGTAGRVEEMQILQTRVRELERELAASGDPPPPGAASIARSAWDAGELALTRGDHEAALVQLERSLAGHVRSSGPESQQVAKTHIALAQVHDAMGSFAQAEQHARRADEICLARLGPGHPLRAATLSALGTIAQRRGEHEAAVRAFRVALQIEQTRPGGGGADLAFARSNLAEALLAVGEPAAALTHAERALTELEANLPADHSELAYPNKALGWALLETGDPEGAKRHLTRALEWTTWSEVEANEIRALLARVQ